MKIEVIIKLSNLPDKPKWEKKQEPNPREKEDSFNPPLSSKELFARKFWELIAGDLEMATCRVKDEIEDLSITCFLDEEELEY
jgi:hypothetical protein